MIKLSFIEEVLSLRAIKKDCSKGCTYGYAVSSPEDLNCSGGILVTGIVPQQPIPEGCAVIGSNILISELGVEYIVVAPDIRTEDIIAEIQKTFAEHSKLQQQKFNILRAAIDTRSLNSLANIVAEYMDSTIMINSSDLTLLAYSGYEISDTIFKSIVNNEQRSVNNIYTYQSGQLMEKVLENDKPVLLNTGAAKDMPRITGKVVINGRPVMFCGAFQSGRTFDWTSIELIDCLCEALKVMVIPGAGDSWTDIEKELIITEILENHMAIDLITKRRIGLKCEDQCLGVYVLDHQGNSIKTFLAISTTIASGSPGKVYLYTSNDDIACGDGLAMCYRAGLPIANMEFIQFHPTILYHPKINSFLISEAVRGEGAILKCRDASGKMVEFMDAYHPMKSLAPRDVVARAIDGEMKRRGEECVFLDIRHHSEATLKRRFPNIFAKCLEADINMSKDLIPVVPAEHYSCGGVRTDVNGFTGMRGLYAVGEVACTGLHGANRLASNSLLEALVVPRFLAKHIMDNRDSLVASRSADQCPAWSCGNAQNSDEMVVISHNWEELRRFMWDYVGIFRTNRRLERAKARIQLLRSEIERFYWDFLVSRDLLELRNIACVAEIIIDSAMSRKESRGLHYNADYPELNPQLDFVDTIIQKKI